MFAFALLDREQGELVLVRDRFGIKPLYYSDAPFAFASELRTLLHVPGIERELDRESLFHYLSLRFVPGERSILAGVKRLPPGHLLRYDLESRVPTVQRWWKLEFGSGARPGRAARTPARRGRSLDARRRSRRRLALGRARLVGASTALLAESGARRAHVLARLRRRGRRAAARPRARRALGHRSPRGGRRRGRAARRSPADGLVARRALRRRASLLVRVPLHGRGREGRPDGDRRRRALRQLPPLRPVRAGTAAGASPRRRAPLPLRAVVLLHRRGEARARCRRAGHVGAAAARLRRERQLAPARLGARTWTSRRSSRTSSCT